MVLTILPQGYVKITAINTDGQVFVDTVGPEDLWYFPAGMPHSIQATNENPSGSEFLLVSLKRKQLCQIFTHSLNKLQVFDQGDFSDDNTFLLTDWMAHVPMEVLAKNFQLPESAFSKIPSQQLYIFPGGL